MLGLKSAPTPATCFSPGIRGSPLHVDHVLEPVDDGQVESGFAAAARFQARGRQHALGPAGGLDQRQRRDRGGVLLLGPGERRRQARRRVDDVGVGEQQPLPAGPLDALLSEAVREVTGLTPSLTTDGGTSDARFIKDYCPVIEFGLSTATIHKADEHVAVADMEQLTAIYRRFISLYFETFGGADAG